jgi:hypothetical protein
VEVTLGRRDIEALAMELKYIAARCGLKVRQMDVLSAMRERGERRKDRGRQRRGAAAKR